MRRRPKNFTDLLKQAENYRWPKKGDRLLRRSDDRNRGVEFAKDEFSRDVYIWDGYMNAAAALIDACEDDRLERQILIYPILFNYRHAIELAMKWIIMMYGCYSSTKIGDIKHHKLWDLWKICRQVITEVGSDDDEDISIVEQVIKDFHDLDKTALAFRYSRDIRGALIALPDGPVDLENVRDVMEAVGHFFEGADGQLDANSSAAPW